MRFITRLEAMQNLQLATQAYLKRVYISDVYIFKSVLKHY